MTPPKPAILFVCVANSFRSQMAEALAQLFAPGRCEIWSAGSQPSGMVHPLAIRLMDELGLDLRRHRSKGLPELPPRQWDVVVTMGCGDACPAVRAVQRFDWAVPDPAGRPLEDARRIRDELAAQVRQLLETVLGRPLDKGAGQAQDKNSSPHFPQAP